ncbi:prolactin receptor a [Dunckerocampus dactyliophorus]|uniref:prolactin receptor a n=1 Tax=Dunckerocampus dactyliophorus TaxID=161453 RepID=UPI0024062EFC|nr:prolactin receptor a [Dunckerocampus dactyliophorus]XP_054612414.1 prolactin receptor a [Dunckerocampus dactyliophorus]
MRNVLKWTCLLLLVGTPHAKGHSPPGKPTLTSCRSPEKETFTCWWQPGSDGGLPTAYALYYRKENSDAVYECPDYFTAGQNSCFFNKNDTSIWVNYNITVVATNRLGSTFSDPVDIDVVYIVQPNPPENVSLTIMEDKGWPFLRVAWQPPRKADTRSGWITLIYEIRIRLERENEWETHVAGQQKLFNIFSLRSGGAYLVQVRCKPDHGFWSEWSSASHIRFPDYFHREKSTWIVITVFCFFIFLIISWLLHMNSHSLKHCLLPPVPGPKIKGFDQQLLKNGKSEDVFSALVLSDFPPMSSSNYEDLLVEYLEVYVPEEQEVMLEESKALHSGCFKSESSTSDSDSGRGSCDSHTLLMDKGGQSKENEDNPVGTEDQVEGEDWEEEGLDAKEDMGGVDVPSGRVKTWPSVFTPLPTSASSPLDQQISREHCLSDSMICTEGVLGPDTSEFSLSTAKLAVPQLCKPVKSRSDINISTFSHKRSVDNDGVRSVMEDQTALLQPFVFQERDYSKVKRIGTDNTLLLQRLADVSEGRLDTCEEQANSAGIDVKATPVCMHATLPGREDTVLATSGYVDTAAIFPMPTY